MGNKKEVIKIDSTKNGISKYKLIADDIERQIKEGILKGGDPMNSELKMQQQYDVSRVTVRKAYKILQDKGIIRTVHGVGTFVNDLYNKDWTWMNSFTSQVIMKGHVPTTKVKKFEIVEADEVVSQKLGIKENEECYFLERLRYIDNQPLWITRSYVPLRVAPGFTAEHLSIAGVTQSIFKVLDMNFDIKCEKSLKIEEYEYINAKEAKILNEEPNQILLLKQSIAYDASNSPVVYEKTTMAKLNRSKEEKSEKKIKLAVHMSMFCKTWVDDIKPHLKKVKEMGFDGVEISLFGSSQEQVKESIKFAKKIGLDVICGTGVSEKTDPSSEDKEIRKQALEYLKRCIDEVAQGGGLFLNGVLYAPWQGFSKVPRETRWKNAAEVLKEAGIYAKEKKIRLHLEVINRFESDFFNTIEEAVAFLKLIDLDNVKLLVDTFHMNIEEDDMYHSLGKYLPYIGCIHICENHRGVPGTGKIDWESIQSILKNKKYEGYLDMETFVESGTEVGSAMYIWNGKNKNSYKEAKKGLQYMKSIMEDE